MNPVKGELHKKPSKGDIAEAWWLWVDLEPREDKPLEEQRAQMLALGTTNLPAGIPKPNVIIDSGRGYWFFWNLRNTASDRWQGRATRQNGGFLMANDWTDFPPLC